MFKVLSLITSKFTLFKITERKHASPTKVSQVYHVAS